MVMWYTGANNILQPNMMNKVLMAGGITALVVAVAALAMWGPSGKAANVKYTFTARGVVTDVDLANKSIKVDVTKAVPAKAKDDIEGNNREFKVGDAKVYKVVSGKDQRVTYKNFVIGQEIGMKGTAYEDDTYVLNFARIHDRSFTVVGTLDSHDKTNRVLKIFVTSSTYKPTTYKPGTRVEMKYFDGNSTFYSKNTKTPVDFSVVNANNQKVKVSGTVTSSNTWEVKTLIDGYTGN